VSSRDYSVLVTEPPWRQRQEREDWSEVSNGAISKTPPTYKSADCSFSPFMLAFVLASTGNWSWKNL
jgi:hypothetical protein